MRQTRMVMQPGLPASSPALLVGSIGRRCGSWINLRRPDLHQCGDALSRTVGHVPKQAGPRAEIDPAGRANRAQYASPDHYGGPGFTMHPIPMLRQAWLRPTPLPTQVTQPLIISIADIGQQPRDSGHGQQFPSGRILKRARLQQGKPQQSTPLRSMARPQCLPWGHVGSRRRHAAQLFWGDFLQYNTSINDTSTP